MGAFLKRRWFLLTCAVLLLACMMIDAGPYTFGQFKKSFKTSNSRIDRGTFVYNNDIGSLTLTDQVSGNSWTVHSPRLGKKPRFELTSGDTHVHVPVWLPLTFVIVLIDILEV